jgi:3D (Asp-Asp-Asp) domain-containing protein
MNQSKYASKWLSVLSLSTLLLTTSVPSAQAGSIFPLSFLKTDKTVQNDKPTYTVPSTKNVETGKGKDVVKTVKVDITAYTSTVEECDGSPFITADGSVVRDGIVATNILPIGTKIRIPAYFGDRVFEVHDRMNTRYSYRVDIWMSDQKAMRTWGLKRNVTIEVVEMGNGKKNWEQWNGRSQDLARIGKYGPDEIKTDS